LDDTADVAAVVGVRVVASPRLLQDAVARSLVGDGLELTEAADSLVAVVTTDHVGDVHSKIVIVLGESTEGDVTVLRDGVRVADREVDAGQLHRLVLELAEQLTHDELTICAPRSPLSPASEAVDRPGL
jgi:hypothetical protein